MSCLSTVLIITRCHKWPWYGKPRSLKIDVGVNDLKTDFILACRCSRMWQQQWVNRCSSAPACSRWSWTLEASRWSSTKYQRSSNNLNSSNNNNSKLKSFRFEQPTAKLFRYSAKEWPSPGPDWKYFYKFHLFLFYQFNFFNGLSSLAACKKQKWLVTFVCFSYLRNLIPRLKHNCDKTLSYTVIYS